MEIRRGRRKLDYTGRVAGGRRQETTITVCDIIMLIQQMEPEGQARGRTGWRGHLLLNHASCEVNRIVNDQSPLPLNGADADDETTRSVHLLAVHLLSAVRH